MISSLKSKFDLSQKRVLLAAGDTVTVYHWNRGELTDSFVFDADESGLAHFARYLRETPNVPLYLMVDIVEEQYRQETIPHVSGADRRILIERKQARLFRGTPYCYALIQGREPEGRRDDQLLLTALTNPDIITPWVRLCLQNKTPLAGIYSLPLLSKSLLPKIGATSSNLLLVTVQGMSGLRQSYFRDGELKLSRLAKMPRLGTVPFGPHILGELDKFQRYLNNLRLLASGPLEVYILSHGELLDDLKQHSHDSDTLHYHLLDVAEVARRLGIQGVLTTPYSDYLFAHLLLQTTPKNHYATSEECKYFRLYQARSGLLAASLLIFLGSLLYSGLNLIHGLSLKWQSTDVEQKASFYQARFQAAKQELPPTPVDPFDIKSAVDIADTLSKYKATPFDMLRTLSRSLDRFQNLYLDEIKWTASTDPNVAIEEATNETRENTATPEPGVRQGTPYRYYQIALVKGYIEPFDGDYRKALTMVNRFADSLRSQNAVQEVKVLMLPLDVSPHASLRGNANDKTSSNEAPFSLKVVLGIGREAS